MPCMCGDICCYSCGPAQGNWRCPICGEWASEGCKHISSRTGKLKKRYEAQAKRIDEAEAKAEAEMDAVYAKLEEEGVL
jgi:hypothetical protein